MWRSINTDDIIILSVTCDARSFSRSLGEHGAGVTEVGTWVRLGEL